MVRKFTPKNMLNITGDPLNDIIYARTRFAGNIFCMMNATTLQENNFFMDMGGINRLFNMGWKSIVVADDIAKRVFFCMQEISGLCQSVDYRYVYESMSGRPDYGRVFETLEDLKKSQSPFFMKKVNPKRILGRSVALEHLERFTSLRNTSLLQDSTDHLQGLGIPCVENKDNCK